MHCYQQATIFFKLKCNHILKLQNLKHKKNQVIKHNSEIKETRTLLLITIDNTVGASRGHSPDELDILDLDRDDLRIC